MLHIALYDWLTLQHSVKHDDGDVNGQAVLTKFVRMLKSTVLAHKPAVSG
jgi:hypothetical protein